MYFAYGWPKVFGLGLREHYERERQQQLISLHTSERYLLGVTASAVHLWSGGLHRVHLSSVRADDETLKEEGHNVAAFYSEAKSVLIVLVSQSEL